MSPSALIPCDLEVVRLDFRLSTKGLIRCFVKGFAMRTACTNGGLATRIVHEFLVLDCKVTVSKQSSVADCQFLPMLSRYNELCFIV